MNTETSQMPPDLSEVNEAQLTQVVYLQAKLGRGGELGRLLSALVIPVRDEPGILNFDLHRSIDDLDLWMMYENWRSEGDFNVHWRQAYVRKFLLDVREILVKAPDIRRFHMTARFSANNGSAFQE
jgi:quinol monooxygenase YgiN